jgi:hypothetical protein
MYVFTINGFPYGGFIIKSLKIKCNIARTGAPDRLLYTRLFDTFGRVTPLIGLDGGVSVSPISYRFCIKMQPF